MEKSDEETGGLYELLDAAQMDTKSNTDLDPSTESQYQHELWWGLDARFGQSRRAD